MPNKNHVNVMALDDDAFILEVLALMLRKQGITQVTTHNSGRQALASFDNLEFPPNLIFLDLNMPEMDGLEFVRHLVERSYSGSLILLSGEDERVLHATEKLVEAHKIPVLGSVRKPLSMEKLSVLLNAWMPVTLRNNSDAQGGYRASELRDAIDNGELVNYYQPKVSVSTGEVVGVEVLVRWNHSSDGLVFPDQFIDLAETHGLIDSLTHVVIDNALSQLRAWKEEGLRLRVALNVSMENLRVLDFADFIATKTTDMGITPQEIVLEVTESQIMQDVRVPLETLTRLRLRRFSLSIDDFGTGHSSLAQLRDIPFSELKIDRGFVHRACSDSTIRAMYDASLSLARKLGMEVIAEGVEDHEDWTFLRQTGCDFAQGYFIAKPMHADDLTKWMISWRKRVSELIAVPG